MARRYGLNAQSFPGLHPNVISWGNSVITNGGAVPSMGTLNTLSTFCSALDVAGIGSQMLAVCCLVPDNLIAATTPVYSVLGNNPWTNNSFVAADLKVNGLIGDGATKYLDTGVLPSQFAGALGTANFASMGLTVYVSQDHSGSEVELAASTTTNEYIDVATDLSGSSFFDCPYASAGGRIQGVPIGAGYYSGNRTSTTAQALYAASSTHAHSTLATGAGNVGALTPESTSSFVAFRAVLTGNPQWSVKRLSFLALHGGLTSGQSVNFFNAIQAMRTSFGGGFV